jgi:hypothetical protein
MKELKKKLKPSATEPTILTKLNLQNATAAEYYEKTLNERAHPNADPC